MSFHGIHAQSAARAVPSHAAIRDHVERVATSALFGHSRRYPVFLRYVVEQTLAGNADALKERTIGVEALGRTPAYDTNQDPVVRSTAAEVRRRLAQFYEADATPVRISIPVGSYVPQFAAVTPAAVHAVSRGHRRPLSALGASVATIFLAALTMAPGPRPVSAIESFWSPLTDTGTVTVAVGRAAGATAGREVVTMSAAVTASKVAAFLQARRAAAKVTLVDAVDLTAPGTGPVVAVGGLNNPWSVTITEPLRFGYERGGSGMRIVDRSSSTGIGWERRVDRSASPARVLEDFALVARVWHPDSGQAVLVVGGLGTHGTEAGGEFVTNEQDLEALSAALDAPWQRQNVEIVLRTTVRDGAAGRPHVVAVHVWPPGWSLRVTQPLRFGYENRGSGTGLQIVDRHGSGTVRWARRFDGSVSPALVVEDVAVVARVRHPDSGQMVLVVGGIGTQGTSAAGEFVTESRYLDVWAQTLAPGWHEQNVEVVISTKVHDGVAGRPHVVATHVWR